MCQRYCVTEATARSLLSALTLLLVLGSSVQAQSSSPSQEGTQTQASARRESSEAPEPARTPPRPGAKADTLSESTVAPGKLAKPPRIDGTVEKDEWKGATRLKLTYQIQPGDNAQPSEATEVMLAYDREHLCTCSFMPSTVIRLPYERA